MTSTATLTMVDDVRVDHRFEVGEVRNGNIELEKLVIEALEGTPFRVEGVLINQQDFTKTANCWGVDNNAKGTNTNRIVLAQRC